MRQNLLAGSGEVSKKKVEGPLAGMTGLIGNIG